MATNILMPALSPTMTEGTLARWLKKEGETVNAGDVIAEIETDKATMEVEAVDEGVLGRILVPDGTQGVKVNDPIAILVEDGEAVPGMRRPCGEAAPAPRTAGPRARAGRTHRRTGAATGAGARCRRRLAGRPHRRLQRCSTRRTGAWRQRPRCRRGADLRLAAGAAHGAAGGHRSARAEGQRAERPHRQGGYRGGDAARPRRRCGRPGAQPAQRAAAAAAARSVAPPRRRSPRRTSWCRTATSGRSSPAG